MSLYTFLDLVLCLVLAGALGFVSQKILGYRLGGFLVSVFIGFIGAYLGKEAAAWLELPHLVRLEVNGRRFPILWSVAGGLAATLLLGMVGRSLRRPKKKN